MSKKAPAITIEIGILLIIVGITTKVNVVTTTHQGCAAPSVATPLWIHSFGGARGFTLRGHWQSWN